MHTTASPTPIATKRALQLSQRREFAAAMLAKGYCRRVVWVVDTTRPGFEERYLSEMAAIVEHERLWRLEHPETAEDNILAPWAIPGWVGQQE